MPNETCHDPHCPCHQYRKAANDCKREERCSLRGPFMISVPNGGMHIHCPVHGQHFLPPDSRQSLGDGHGSGPLTSNHPGLDRPLTEEEDDQLGYPR